MGDKFTALKFQWLEGIASDPELPASAARLAIALNKHLNRKTWDAFPAVATLARAIGRATTLTLHGKCSKRPGDLT
jgi:hypothetical protein